MPRTRVQPHASRSGMWRTSAYIPAAAGILVVTGTYTGDGNATQAIAGVGFQPIYLIVYDQVNSTHDWFSKTTSDGLFTEYGKSFPTESRYEEDYIISLDADGFTVGDGTGGTLGNVLNTNATVYTYIAFGGSGSSQIAVGTYTGDGNATQAITGVGFQPTWLLVLTLLDNSNGPGMKTDQDGLNTRGQMYRPDMIISLDADGFTVGDGTGFFNIFNVNARDYGYIAAR